VARYTGSYIVVSWQSLVTDLLATKLEWFENTTNATTNEIQSAREELENALAPIFNKLGEPGELTGCLVCLHRFDQ